MVPGFLSGGHGAYDIEFLMGNKGKMRTVCGWSIFHGQYDFDRLERYGAEEESRESNRGFRLALVPVKTQEDVAYEDVAASLEQIARLKAAGCQIARLAVPNMEAARSFAEICRESRASTVRCPSSPIRFFPCIKQEMRSPMLISKP